VDEVEAWLEFGGPDGDGLGARAGDDGGDGDGDADADGDADCGGVIGPAVRLIITG